MSQYQIPRKPVLKRHTSPLDTIKEESREAGSLSSSPLSSSPDDRLFDMSFEEFITQFEQDTRDSDLNKHSSWMFKLRQSLLVASKPKEASSAAPVSTTAARPVISAPVPKLTHGLSTQAPIDQDDEWHWDRNTVLIKIDAEGMLAVLAALIRNETGEWMREAWAIYLVVSAALEEKDGQSVRIRHLFHSVSSSCIDAVRKSTNNIEKTADKIGKGLHRLIRKDAAVSDRVGEFVHRLIRRMINIQRMKEQALQG
ncbi:hypothetical protein H2199_005889 [Coniosporium tulheliwenetii]|uniref:Uncharacterized protein n=1 Tax=Coniosporium tulheliwenetii TaxID=3383036 RepID=A0ACC2YZ82_9PEZI|nr:hypothetical protein H2199_005889 [Cladosporium sp. JES 115]